MIGWWWVVIALWFGFVAGVLFAETQLAWIESGGGDMSDLDIRYDRDGGDG